MDNKITAFDNFVYYVYCFLTLGGVFVAKVIAKKAISEMVK